MIQEWLADINSVKGVRSSFVCDTMGRVIADAFPADSEGDWLGACSRELARTVAALGKVVGDVVELDLACERARIVVRSLKSGLVGVVCDFGVDMAMLRLMLNVAATRLRDDGEVQSQLQAKVEESDVLGDLDEISWQLLQALDGKDVNYA